MLNNRNVKRKCVICKEQIITKSKFFPFCSRKCVDEDLSRWLNEKYAISKNIIMEEK